MGDEFRIAALLAGLCFQPIDDGRSQRVRITLATMGEVSFPGDHIHDAVSIDVCKIDGMELAEIHTLGIFLRLGSEDSVGLKFDLTAGIPALIFEPEESVAMREFRAENIIVPIAVEIIGEHLRASRAAELHLVLRPFETRVLGLFPPAIFFQQVDAAIAIHIAIAQAVREAFAGRFLTGNFLEWPFLGGVGRVG